MGEPYCSYILGGCALGYGSNECKQRNPVACRNCRQKIEKEANDDAGGSSVGALNVDRVCGNGHGA
jgi:hypothetical protein